MDRTEYYSALEKSLLWLGVMLLAKESPSPHAAAFLEFIDHGEYGLALDELEALVSQQPNASSEVKALLQECKSFMERGPGA